MNSDNNLIGNDRLTTVNAYYLRNLEMNINNNNNIIKSLKKLGYYNLDVEEEYKRYYIDTLFKKIDNELSNNWDSSIKNKTINDLMSDNIDPSLTSRIDRSNILSKYLNKDDTLDFYNDLTLEELNYLGY